MHWFDGLIVVGAERRRRTILSRSGGRLAAARRPPHRLNALSRIVSFDDVPVARRRMMCGQPEQGFERNVFDCAGAGRVLGVRIGLPDWNNVLAMPGHRVCTAVAMQPPAGPPQVESDLADRRQPETNYRRAAWGQYGERYLSFEFHEVPASGGGFPSSKIVQNGYPLHTRSTAGRGGLPLTIDLYGAGQMATACWASLWKRSPLACERRRLNRKVNSSR